jgi:hypothetical protein
MADWKALEAWMVNPRSNIRRDCILDDAVLGCLQTNEVHELLEDYGIEFNKGSISRFGMLLDKAITEHNL